MKQEQIDELLRALARKPMPACPANLEASVWRAIRLHELAPRGFAAILDDAAESVWRAKTFALSAFTATLVGALVAFSWQAAAPDATAGALGLRVFSADAPALPSTLLTQ